MTLAKRPETDCPVFTNACRNRQAAIDCLLAGMNATDIVDEWPLVWRLADDGKLSQIYDSIYHDGREETCYTMAAVKEVIASHCHQVLFDEYRGATTDG
jgi:hypothetical protein